MTLRAGVIGLGQMGSGVAACLARAGRALTVYDIDPGAALRWDDGVLVPPVASSCREVASRSDVVIIMVVSAAQVDAVLSGPDGLLAGARPGLVAILGSTISMHDLTALREKAGAAGTVLIDCGVTSSPGGHSRKGIIGMVGADPAVFEYVREVLDDAMQQVFLMGGPGAGMATKIVRNLLYYATWRAASDSAELADAVGIDVGKLAAIHALSEQNGSAATVWFRARAARNEGVHAPSVGQQHLVDLMVKDLDAATSVSVEAGLDLPLIDIVRTGAHRTTEPWR